MAVFSMRNSTLPSADLDLTEASVVLLESTVNMNGHNLLLNPDTTITIRLDTDTPDYIPFFTNVGELEIAGGGLIERGSDLTEILNVTYTGNEGAPDSIRLIYNDNGNTSLMIPEPATATLSLLALAGLTARRRRR